MKILLRWVGVVMLFFQFQNFIHAKDSNDFALNFYQQLAAASSGNFFFSPYSFSEAFSVCALGAKGKTLEEITSVFHFQSNISSRLHLEKARGVTLEVANGIWVEKTFSLLPEFEKKAREQSPVQIESVDFRNEAETARVEINHWVEKQTKDKIQDLLPAGSVKSITEVVIANALYFLGKWDEPFEARSFKEPFYCEDGAKPEVIYFTDKRELPYAEKEGVKGVQLNYVGGKFSMLVFLPESRKGLADLEKRLSPEWLEDVVQSLRVTEVNFRMPRFQQEFEVTATDYLQRMGLNLVFTDNADFSGMAQKPLKISDVIHKAFIEVNEIGAEAAASTAIVMETATARPDPTPIKLFQADHPFLFAIRENKTGKFLFMGRCVTP
jgi:serpin B